MKILILFLALMGSAVAQTPVPSASPASVIVPVTGSLTAVIAANGGLIAFIAIILLFLNGVLSALRTFLYKIDGVNPGDPIPADKTALTFVNKIAIYVGKALDFLQGNVQH